MPTTPPSQEPPPLADDSWCFACGRQNPQGLHTTWTMEADGTARARFLPEKRHQGWTGVVHGGILAALLDEAMAQRVRLSGKGGVTASLNVRFRRPAPTGSLLLVGAVLLSQTGRVLRLRATIEGEDGVLYAEADGVYVRMRSKAEPPTEGPPA